jgi:uncharacterized membrane protein YqiK
MNRKLFISIIIVIIIVYWSYLYFERYLTETVEEITIVNSEKYGDMPEKYLIFTPHEVFLDENNRWQDKYNADELFQKLKKGHTYKVIIVGKHIPFISEFRNIIDLAESDKSAISY